MKLQVIGCSHHKTDLALREKLAFDTAQTREALTLLRERYPASEMVLVSTCNRVEFYAAAENDSECPDREQLAQFLADFHGLDPVEVFEAVFEETGDDAVRHLFMVSASLDSMVVGEAQILSQVKKAYELAKDGNSAGALTHSVFQAAIRVAKRVATETGIHQKRVSIPSVAVADFASGIFERFDDKEVLVIGAGEMAEETLRYLVNEGATNVTVINRSRERAQSLAEAFSGRALDWSELHALLVHADLVISTTGSEQPIVTVDDYRAIARQRDRGALFVLDLAVPRDFEPAISEYDGVYLYAIDDLKRTCEDNLLARAKQWPKAEKIIDEETVRFLANLNHRATAPTIQRLKAQANKMKQDEYGRLMNKLQSLDERSRDEIERAFDRLVNKLLHPPLESLRDEAQSGSPHGLLDALRRLFQLKD